MSAEFVARKTFRTDHRTPLRFVWSHISRHPWLALLMMFGAFSNAALAAAIPYFIGLAMNELARNPNEIGLQYTAQMAVAIVVSQLIRGVLQLMRNASSEAYGQLVERDVRDELYGSLLGKSMAFHDLMPVGEIMARVTNDVREMNLMMNPGLNLIIGSGWFLIIPVVAAPLTHPHFIIVPLSFVILHTLVQIQFVQQLHPIAEEVRSSFGRMNARLAESLDGLQVVKGAAQEKQERAYFDALADVVRDRFIQQGAIEARYLSGLLLPVAFVAAFIHSVILYRAGGIQIGDVGYFVGLIMLFGFPVFSSLNSLSRLALGYAGA